MRNKLQAVQDVMRRVGKHPADELDTDGVSVAAHVERALDDANLTIQNEGWWWNTKYDIEVTLDANKKAEVGRLETDTAIAITAATEANPCVISADTTNLRVNDRIYISDIVGMTELNDRYFRVLAIPAAGTYSIDEDASGHTTYGSGGYTTPLRTVYHVDTHGSDANVHVTRQGEYLYDLNENVDTFESDLKINYVYNRKWQEIPDAYQMWIISLAAQNFNRNYIGNGGRDSVLQQEVMESKRQAFREEIRVSDVNLLATSEMQQIRGRPRMPDRRIY